MERLVVERAETGEPLWQVEVAQSWLSRLRGLIGRHSLGPSEGLYLPGTNGVHMLLMRFPIDCLFVRPAGDGQSEVVAIRENLAPWTGMVWWVRRARGALELPAGSAARAGISIGERLRFAP